MHIIESFKNQGIARGGLLFFHPDLALQIVDQLEAANVDIFGIDGFKVTETVTQPFMEHSVDFEYTEKNWERARDFLEKKRDLGLVFEIVARGE